MVFDFQIEAFPLWIHYLAMALMLSLLIFYVYFLLFFRKAFSEGKKESPQQSQTHRPVSVVIAAKNEYLNLRENLPFILNQDYPDFEVVVVDDHSQDDTWDLLCAFRIQNQHLRTIRLTDSVVVSEGKKFPLSVGIKEARFPLLLLTDADCRPVGPDWISHMVAKKGNNTQFILGYGKYYRRKGLLNKLIRFDTLKTAMLYFGAAQADIPYMGVGRNLSYSRELFIRSGGFVQHYDLTSGDDDLFVSEHSTGTNTSVCFHPGSFTFSEPKHRFRSWWHQKRRHFTTGKRYRFIHKLYLGIYSMNLLLFPTLLVLLFILEYPPVILAGAALMKWIIQWIAFSRGTKKLKESKLLLISPVFETIMVLLYSLIHITNIINKPGKWK